jgi:hypothetical protein
MEFESPSRVATARQITDTSAMIQPIGSFEDIGHTIQLSVAPVFLLSGIGAILNVLTARLGRVIDRARQIEKTIDDFDPDARQAAIAELSVLDRRMGYAHWAITCCTISALLVSAVVAIIFIGDLLNIHRGGVLAALFIAAMAMLFGGLLLFLTEIRVATRSVRVRADYLIEHQG